MKKPRLFKKRTSKPVPKGAEFVRYRGRLCARWKGQGQTGRIYTVPLNEKRTRIVYESDEWWVGLEDGAGEWQQVRAYRDKTASQALMVELVKKAERGQSGLADPLESQRKRPIDEHLRDFEKYLESKDNTAEHTELTMQRVRSVMHGIKAKVIGDITPGRVGEYLAKLRREGLPIPEGSNRKPKPLSASSSNHYLKAVRSFCHWLVRDRRVEASPVAGLSAVKTGRDVKRKRRPLTDREFVALVEAARASEEDFRGLSGEDRGMLYTAAVHTGLRVSELASLKPTSLYLDEEPYLIRVAAAYTKNREEAEIELREDFATALREWAAGKSEDKPLWPGTWSYKASAMMLRVDLRAAGIPYQDPSGRYADFHALRHTYVTGAVRSGAHPKTVMEMARHSKLELTLGVYTHTVREDRQEALEGLPPVPQFRGQETQRGALAATGTDDTHAPVRAPVRAQYARNAVSRGQIEGTEGNAWQRRQPENLEAPKARKPLQKPQISKARHSLTSPAKRRGRRDSNPQPPDRQSGTLAN